LAQNKPQKEYGRIDKKQQWRLLPLLSTRSGLYHRSHSLFLASETSDVSSAAIQCREDIPRAEVEEDVYEGTDPLQNQPRLTLV
jgi:hypothetical protein